MSSSCPSDPAEAGIPHPPQVAGEVFGARLPNAIRYAALLAGTGVTHGLIGPREVPRLWDRHILNCAVVGEAMPVAGARVIDVGSGAGLPGVALAIARTEWLATCVAELRLANVTVHRGRADAYAGSLTGRYVTARAVARLPKLLGWCAPLAESGGEIVVMKGSSAAVELAEAAVLLRSLHLGAGRVVTVGAALPDPTTLVVVARRPRS